MPKTLSAKSKRSILAMDAAIAAGYPMSAHSRVTKTITQVQRRGRREGHPVYRVTFSDGTDAITKAGAQINYGIANSDYRGAEVEATFDGNLLIGVVRTDGVAPLGAV